MKGEHGYQGAFAHLLRCVVNVPYRFVLLKEQRFLTHLTESRNRKTPRQLRNYR